MDNLRRRKEKITTDAFYASFICLRSVPASKFFSQEPANTQLSITSLGEQRMLTALGLPSSERSLIEGLKFKRSSGDSLNERQLANRAIVRLASNPPPEVGSLQRRTRGWLLRPYRVSREVRTSVASPLTDSNSRVSPQLLAFDSLAIT
eukprot:4657716-Prymnesium_polylepis.1